MANTVDDVLFNFVIENTKIFDESHNHVHAMKVTHLAHIIMKSLRQEYNEKLLTYIAMLHDVCDHKYQNAISKDVLSNFITTNLSSENEPVIMKIIDNISFSKEDKGLRETIPEQYNDYLTAVSDADKLEALGAVGLERCIEFTKARGGEIPDDVVKHCHEKLLRLLPENFIKTSLAKEMAAPLHDVITEYTDTHKIKFF
jgi:uncharacterized protein